MMFTQVYFHHTRRAFDYHIGQALKEILRTQGNEFFPSPTTKENVQEYLKWDDWVVYGLIKDGLGGRHGEILQNRNHDRNIHQTPEIPTGEELTLFDQINAALGSKVTYIDKSESSWYKFGKEDVHVLFDENDFAKHLSFYSTVVKGLNPVMRRRIYVENKDKKEAKKIVDGLLTNGEKRDANG